MSIVFGDLFQKSNWQPIDHNGRKIMIADEIVLPFKKGIITVHFISFSSDWEQGIFLSTKGTFKIENELINNITVLKQSTAPKVVKMFVDSKTGLLKVWNAWNAGNGTFYYGTNGAALYFEEIERGRKYFCNDGFPDDDFNDMIFTINW